MSDVDFDTWYNDGEGAPDELQNQAAALDDATQEERTLRDGSNIGEKGTELGGHLLVKFQDSDGKCMIKKGSAQIVAMVEGDNTYVLATARTNLCFKENADAETINADSGFFFLQRSGKSDYVAKCGFKADDVRHFMKEDFAIDDQVNVEGNNLSAVILRGMEGKDGASIPEPALLEYIDDDTIKAGQYTVSGYPAQVLDDEGKPQPNEFCMYSTTGGILLTQDTVFGVDTLTSKGQEGGGLVNAETGMCVGIYTGVEDKLPEGKDAKLGSCVRFNEERIQFINDILNCT